MQLDGAAEWAGSAVTEWRLVRGRRETALSALPSVRAAHGPAGRTIAAKFH